MTVAATTAKAQGPADVSLTLDFPNGKIVADPEIVTIYMKEGTGRPGQVRWVVQNLGAGQTLHMAGKQGQPDMFPHAEKTITLPRTHANSGGPARKGSWRYDLWVTEEGKPDRLLLTDPQVRRRGGGG